jgi:hypothetical protein
MPAITKEDAMSDVRIPATGVKWFNPLRFDEPKPADPEPADPVEGEDPADPETDPTPEGDEPDEPGDKPDDALGEAGKKALDRMKAEKKAALKAATDARRQAAELAKKVAEFEDRDKSELDRANAKAERATEREVKATARAVSAEVRALSVNLFADPSDAADVLMKDPSKYVDADGDIDTDAIEADLADLLERKPHWAKPESAARTDPETEPAVKAKAKPKPDPGQGSRGAPAPIDYRTASSDELAAELAKYRYRQRSL